MLWLHWVIVLWKFLGGGPVIVIHFMTILTCPNDKSIIQKWIKCFSRSYLGHFPILIVLWVDLEVFNLWPNSDFGALLAGTSWNLSAQLCRVLDGYPNNLEPKYWLSEITTSKSLTSIHPSVNFSSITAKMWLWGQKNRQCREIKNLPPFRCEMHLYEHP